MPIHSKLLLLFLVLIITACTAAPMVALMGYDTIGKRKRWLERAEAGDVYAQYDLAQSYCCGIEGEHNPKEAMRWWCTAAKNGYAHAQYRLGTLYEGQMILEGYPIAQEYPKAYMWYMLAKRRGNEEARENALRLEKELDKNDLKKGENLLKDWKGTDCGPEDEQ